MIHVLSVSLIYFKTGLMRKNVETVLLVNLYSFNSEKNISKIKL